LLEEIVVGALRVARQRDTVVIELVRHDGEVRRSCPAAQAREQLGPGLEDFIECGRRRQVDTALEADLDGRARLGGELVQPRGVTVQVVLAVERELLGHEVPVAHRNRLHRAGA
jgi:hypothetical protein